MLEKVVALFVDTHYANVPNIFGSCIVVHNICKTCGDHRSNEWMVKEGSHDSGHGTSTTATTQGSTRKTIRDELQQPLK